MKTFGSFGEFALHLGEVFVKHAALEQELLEEIGEAVEHRAKAKFGEYQDQAGPFVAWAELADSTKADRERQGYPEDEPLLRSGETRESIHHHVGDNKVEIGSDSQILEWQELGTDKMPPRSTLAGALVDLAPGIVSKIGRTVVMTLEGERVFQGSIKIEP